MDEIDERIEAWEQIARHPFFQDCHEIQAPLLTAVLDKLNGLTEKSIAVEAKQAEEPVENRIVRAFLNGYREGMERASRHTRLDHW